MRDALDLLEAHQYAKAITAYQKNLEHNPVDWSSIDGLACALQAYGDYQQALPLFERVDEYERQKLKGHPGRKREIACIYWCLGNHQKAIELMSGLVNGVLNGSIEFGDPAGGAQQGLLLNYMAVTAKDQKAEDFAIGYLRKLSNKKRFNELWPGPVVLFILGELSYEELLISITKMSNIEDALKVTKSNFLALRRMCVCLFHCAVKFKKAGDVLNCQLNLQRCISLENPLVEPEWYLAKNEVDSHSKSTTFSF